MSQRNSAAVYHRLTILYVKELSPGVGGYSLKFWVGTCHWDTDILTYYQTMFTCIVQPHFRLDTKQPSSIPDKPSVNPYSRLNYSYNCFVSQKGYPVLDQSPLICIPYPRLNWLKTIPFTVAHTHPPPKGLYLSVGYQVSLPEKVV